MAQAWPIIISCIPLAIILSIVTMYLMKKASKIVVYTLLSLSVLACPALGIYLLIVPTTSKSASNVNKLL